MGLSSMPPMKCLPPHLNPGKKMKKEANVLKTTVCKVRKCNFVVYYKALIIFVLNLIGFDHTECPVVTHASRHA